MYESFHEESLKNDSKWSFLRFFNISCCPRIACSYLVHVLSYRFQYQRLKDWLDLGLCGHGRPSVDHLSVQSPTWTAKGLQIIPLFSSAKTGERLMDESFSIKSFKRAMAASCSSVIAATAVKKQITAIKDETENFIFLFSYSFLWLSMFRIVVLYCRRDVCRESII